MSNETALRLQCLASNLRDSDYDGYDGCCNELADDLAECVRLIIALLEENACAINALQSAGCAPDALSGGLTAARRHDILRNEVGPPTVTKTTKEK